MSLRKITSFEKYKNIYFIGIGGIGISALARLLKYNGFNVSGSDKYIGKNIKLLENEGITIFTSHSQENISSEIDLIIHTTAISADNHELLAAKRKNIKTLTYPEAVGLLTEQYKTISISGTHGKTTTTAMLGLVFQKANLNPNVIVGSLIKEFQNTNFLYGTSDFLILESCEYKDAFLNYSPEVIIINNIEPDHLDYFKSDEKYIESYENFISKLSPTGFLVVNIDDPNVQKILSKLEKKYKIITFGESENADYQLINKTIHNHKHTVDIKLSVPGKHNLLNATASFAAFNQFSDNIAAFKEALENFNGTHRRFEIKGTKNNTVIIDDYGHTPTEIKATISAVKSKYGDNSKILCIFQPHQYSRTRIYLDKFANALSECTKVFIPNIYESRDTKEDMESVNVDDLVNAINSISQNTAINTLNLPSTMDLVKKQANSFDVIITQGAGDITELSDDLVKALKYT